MYAKVTIEIPNKHAENVALYEKVVDLKTCGWSLNDSDHRIRYINVAPYPAWKPETPHPEIDITVQVIPGTTVYDCEKIMGKDIGLVNIHKSK